MVREREEETLAKEVEAWVEQTSQILLSLAGSLIIPASFFGYPFRLVGSWGMKVG